MARWFAIFFTLLLLSLFIGTIALSKLSSADNNPPLCSCPFFGKGNLVDKLNQLYPQSSPILEVSNECDISSWICSDHSCSIVVPQGYWNINSVVNEEVRKLRYDGHRVKITYLGSDLEISTSCDIDL